MPFLKDGDPIPLVTYWKVGRTPGDPLVALTLYVARTPEDHMAGNMEPLPVEMPLDTATELGQALIAAAKGEIPPREDLGSAH